MRRILYTMISTITLATAVVLALLVSQPSTGSITYVPHAPSATPTMAQCATEDGAGQALCMWQGTVSGDCAPSVMGDSYTSGVCVQVHSMGEVQWTNPDGSTGTTYGPDMVGECVSIMQDGRMDKDAQTILDNEGWTILECLRAQM